MLRLPVLALAALLLLSPAARADTQTIFAAGPWILYAGTSNTGHSLCGMRVSDNSGSRTIHIKYFAGDDHLTIQIFKNSWQVPNGMRLAVTMQMDGNPLWTARAVGTADHIEFTIPYAGIDSFSNEFRYSTQMRIAFPEGSESPWVTSLSGTNIMLERFVSCMQSIRGAPGPGAGPTQPFAGPPATTPGQPFGSAPTPTQPGPSAASPDEAQKDGGGQPGALANGPTFGGAPAQPYRGNDGPSAPAPPAAAAPAGPSESGGSGNRI